MNPSKNQTIYNLRDFMAASHYFLTATGQTEGIWKIIQKKANIAPTSESKFLWILTFAFALAGILLRIEKALLGRSFRGDEAAMASAIQNHSLYELLTKPLGGSITAPLGFLAVEKLIVQLLGFQDIIYRLIPLLAGCFSVILMFLLAKELLTSLGAAFAVGAFSLNWMLSFYSSDLKQYSTDVVIALIIYLMAARYFKKNSTTNLIWLAGVGLIGIFCSHPAIFMLSSIGLALIYQTWGDIREFKKIFLIGALWIGVFLILYFFSYRFVGQNSYNISYWNNLGALMPMPPWKNPGWFLQRLGNFFVVDLNLSQWIVIEAGLYLFGIVLFFSGQNRPWSFIFFGSIIFTLLASGIANYPFKGRLILFLAPSTFLAIGAGMDGLAVIIKSPSFLSHGIRWLLTAYLLLGPVSSTYNYLQEPRSFPFKEDIKPALLYIEQHKETNDQIVVYDQAAFTYGYYAPFYGLSNSQTIVIGDYRKEPQKYRLILDSLPRNQRIWFIFTNVLYTLNNVLDSTYIFDYLNTIGGNIIEQYGGNDTFSSAYLVIIK
jgi:hypothetical protein